MWQDGRAAAADSDHAVDADTAAAGQETHAKLPSRGNRIQTVSDGWINAPGAAHQ